MKNELNAQPWFRQITYTIIISVMESFHGFATAHIWTINFFLHNWLWFSAVYLHCCFSTYCLSDVVHVIVVHGRGLSCMSDPVMINYSNLVCHIPVHSTGTWTCFCGQQYVIYRKGLLFIQNMMPSKLTA